MDPESKCFDNFSSTSVPSENEWVWKWYNANYHLHSFVSKNQTLERKIPTPCNLSRVLITKV